MRISDWSSDVCSSDLTQDQVGAYRFRIRNPVIASGAKQSRAVCAHSGLLRSARNDEARRLADAKGKIADQVRGDEEGKSTRLLSNCVITRRRRFGLIATHARGVLKDGKRGGWGKIV